MHFFHRETGDIREYKEESFVRFTDALVIKLNWYCRAVLFGCVKLALFPKEMINQSSKLIYTFIKLIAIAIFHTPYSNILKV